jgi:hypothetical protein
MRTAPTSPRPEDIISTPEMRSFLLLDDGAIPNNPKLPLLIYIGANENRTPDAGKLALP